MGCCGGGNQDVEEKVILMLVSLINSKRLRKRRLTANWIALTIPSPRTILLHDIPWGNDSNMWVLTEFVQHQLQEWALFCFPIRCLPLSYLDNPELYDLYGTERGESTSDFPPWFLSLTAAANSLEIPSACFLFPIATTHASTDE